jgi:hypothetical protein
LAAATPASAQRAPAAGDPAPSIKPAPDETRSLPPIAFFVARGDPNACGVGCREWIAAEGTIDKGADDRLRALLQRLGGRKLPIFFHSPGGSVGGGLAIGRLIRQRGLTVGLGWTVPAGCDPKQQREPACNKLKRSGRDLVAVLDTGHTMCNSACVLAFVGGAVREVEAQAVLGVHSISFALKHVDADGRVTRTPSPMTPAVERKAFELWYGKIAAYLREMGVSQDLLAAMRAVENERLRFLTREQIAAFGIDRRQAIESLWWFVDRSSGPSAVKVIEENRAGTFQKDFLSLTCRSASTVRLLYGRDAGPNAPDGPWSVRLRLTASGGSFLFGRPYRAAGSGAYGPRDVQSVELPISLLGDAAFTIEEDGTAAAIVGVVARNSSISKVTVQSTGPGLGELSRRCGNDKPRTKDAPTERI